MASIADPSVSARTSGIRNRLDMNGTSYILPDDCVRGCVNGGGKLTASVSRRQDVSSQGGYRGSSGQLGSRFERCVVCTGAAARMLSADHGIEFRVLGVSVRHFSAMATRPSGSGDTAHF